MFSICKTTVRSVAVLGVLAGLAAGGTLLLAGPDRAKALFDEVREGVVQKIDENIDDPTAMRRELIELEKEYPKRISAVRGDLAELSEQIRQLERERDIATQVVALADRDLDELQPLLAEAQDARLANAEQLVSIRFAGGVYEYDRALARAKQIKDTRSLYAGRAADAEHDLTYLRQQADRLGDLAAQLATERAEFQAQIGLLSRQVDAIARNERLIDLMEERNRTIEECSRFEVLSLDEVTARLAEIRSRQEAELDLLTSQQQTTDYEALARETLELDAALAEPESAGDGAGEVTLTRVWKPIVIGD